MNLLRSSQFKIALVSVLTSTTVLFVFGGLALWQMRANRLQTLDRELKELGGFIALSARWPLSSKQVQDFVRQRIGEDRAPGCIYAVQQTGAGSFQSAQWPRRPRLQAFEHSSEVVEPDFGKFGGPPGPPGEDGKGPRQKSPPPDGRNPFDPFGDTFPDDRPPVGPRGDKGRMNPPRLYAPVTTTVFAEGHTYRLGVFGHAETGTIIHVGFDLDVFARDLNFITHAFWWALPMAMIFVAGGAWLAARRSLVPVQRLSEEMEKLSPSHLQSRLESADTDIEFHRITEAYNAMLGRLERSFKQATRFSADASHELKTPLAVMRATLEKALSHSTDGSAEQGIFASLLDEADHLQSIIEALLLLSRADAGKLTLSTERLDLVAWLRPLIEDAGLMAEARHIAVHEDLGASASIAADPVLLNRAVHNLFRNAVAYNNDGGDIWCSTHKNGTHVVLTVTNTGTPIPANERARVFERFARGSNAGGTGEGRGLGIGLSLSREIVLAHGGTLELVDGEAGRTTFELKLPLA